MHFFGIKRYSIIQLFETKLPGVVVDGSVVIKILRRQLDNSKKNKKEKKKLFTT